MVTTRTNSLLTLSWHYKDFYVDTRLYVDKIEVESWSDFLGFISNKNTKTYPFNNITSISFLSARGLRINVSTGECFFNIAGSNSDIKIFVKTIQDYNSKIQVDRTYEKARFPAEQLKAIKATLFLILAIAASIWIPLLIIRK